MRSLRSFFFLLLCVCILFGVFSLSAFAQEGSDLQSILDEYPKQEENTEQSFFNDYPVNLYVVDEFGQNLLANEQSYTVVIKWRGGTSGNWNQFTSPLPLEESFSTLQLYFEIALAEPIDRNTHFDFKFSFNSDSYTSLSTGGLNLYDSSWNRSTYDSPVLLLDQEKRTIDGLDLFNDRGKVSYLTFVLTFNDPIYDKIEIPVDPEANQFFFNGMVFQFDTGMTWQTWWKSDYNTLGESSFKKNSSGFFYFINGSSTENIYPSSGGAVQSYTEISSDKYYSQSYLSTKPEVYKEYSVFTFIAKSISISTLDEDEVTGGILGFIKSIWNGIVNLPSNIAGKISGFFTELGNKISSLGDKILDGIKSLFIPTEADLTNMKVEFEELLATRFGALYESTTIIDGFANAFYNSPALVDSADTIELPEISVNLAGANWTFGGYDVDIIPDKFQGIVDVLKVITTISCVFLFVNALRKRLEGMLT